MPAHPRPIPRTEHPAAHDLAGPGESLLGFGPSGVVYGGVDRDGSPTTRKVFECDTLTRAVQYFTLGAASPYAWNEHAVRCALLRRRILGKLVQLWFPGELRVSQAYSHGWDERYSALELRTDPLRGRAPQLAHPLDPDGSGEAHTLWTDLLPRLQNQLRAAGFDGLLWLAGEGNPVAMANFRLESSSTGRTSWLWTDLESGVPALFPLRISALWRTYLPLCRKHGRVLFDDVDVDRLEGWLSDHGQALDACAGPGSAHACASDAAALRLHQEAWRNQPRRAAAVAAQVAKGRIAPEQAERFARQPLAWYGFETRRLLHAVGKRALGFAKRQRSRMSRIPWRRLPAAAPVFLVSQRFRERIARELVQLRVRQWVARGQLEPAHAKVLSQRAAQEEPCAYLSDFAVHLCMKPFVKGFEYLGMPLLWATGRVDEATLGLVIVLGGCLARTAYTALRCAQEVLRGRRAPWLALGVGALPVFGNLAFPLQIVRSSREEDGLLAGFLLFDGCALIGRRLPVWGGRNTATEHGLGQLARRLTATTPDRTT